MPLDPGSRKMPDSMDANEVSVGSERSRSHHLDRLLTTPPPPTEDNTLQETDRG